MLVFFYIAILLINVLFFSSGKKNKFVMFVSYLFILLFVMGKRYDGSKIAWDLGNYIERFDNYLYIEDLAEGGYWLLTYLAHLVGLSFESFYMIVTFIIVTGVFYTAYKIGKNIHGVAIAYLIYFILCPMDQLRNQLALVILLFLFPLSERNDFKIIIKEVALILFSSLFHFTFILYLIPYVLTKLKNKKLTIVFPYFAVLLTLATLFLGKVSFISELLQYLEGMNAYTAERYAKYSDTTTSLSFLAPLFIYVILVYGMNVWQKTTDKRLNPSLSYSFCVYAGLFLPLLLVNATMYRMIRDVTLLGIIHLNYVHDKTKRFLYLAIIIGISVGWFIFDIILKGYYDDYISNFFNNAIL